MSGKKKEMDDQAKSNFKNQMDKGFTLEGQFALSLVTGKAEMCRRNLEVLLKAYIELKDKPISFCYNNDNANNKGPDLQPQIWHTDNINFMQTGPYVDGTISASTLDSGEYDIAITKDGKEQKGKLRIGIDSDSLNTEDVLKLMKLNTSKLEELMKLI